MCIAVTPDGLLVGSGPSGGHRPVYVTSSSELAVATTSVATLLLVAEQSPRLNVDCLALNATSLPYYAPTETPYVGIERLRPSEAWLVSLGRATARFSLGRRLDETTVAESDCVELLRSALQNVVDRFVRSSADFGVLLSGGLDSSAILAAACKSARVDTPPRSIRPFTYDFDTDDPGDDRPHRRSLLRHLAVEAERVTPEDAAPLVRDCLVLDAMPSYAVQCAFTVEAGRRARRAGAEFLLTGVGGDSVVEGRPWLLVDLARKGRLAAAIRLAARLRSPYGDSAAQRIIRFVLRPLVASWVPPSLRRRRRRSGVEHQYPWAGPVLRRWIRQRHDAADVPEPRLDSSPAEWYSALSQMPFIAGLAGIRAQVETASGCASRDPFFDDELLAAVARVPPLTLLYGGWRRGLLRHAMATSVPDDVCFRRTKADFTSAIARMVECAGGLAAFTDLADVRKLADLGLAEPRPFRRMFDRLAADLHQPLWWRVWPALAVEAFLRQHDEGALS